jgi:hypothetical protein
MMRISIVPNETMLATPFTEFSLADHLKVI